MLLKGVKGYYMSTEGKADAGSKFQIQTQQSCWFKDMSILAMITSLSYIFSFTSITVRKSLEGWRLKVKVLFHFSFTFWQRDR